MFDKSIKVILNQFQMSWHIDQGMVIRRDNEVYQTTIFRPEGESSHFGKKIVSRKISFKKIVCTTLVKLKSIFIVICLIPLFAVFGKVCGLDVSQCI